MRAIFIFLISIILILTGCASVEVVKEISKATKSIEASITKIIKPKKEDNEKSIIKEESLEQTISIEKKQITQDKKKIGEVVAKQKKLLHLIY